MQFFRHAVFGNGLIERRKVAFRAGGAAVAEGLHHALAVDAVVHAEGLAVLLQRTQFVERGVGDGLLVGEVLQMENAVYTVHQIL